MAARQQNSEQVPQWRDNLPPHVFDHIASETPDRVYGLWPNHPFSYELGFRSVTFGDLANAIDGLAWWIEKQLGLPSRKEEVLTYVGPNDMRYVALGLAAVKTGYLLFLTSPRNSPAAHRALFGDLQCNTLLMTEPTPPPVTPIIQAVAPRVLAIPDISQLLGERHLPYPYSKSWEDARSDGGLILHTSGSTGIPKPVVWVHETSSRSKTLSALKAPDEFETIEGLFRGKRIMVTLPPFHGAGVGHYLFNPVCLDTIPIAPAAQGIVTARGLVEALKQTPAEVALLVPSVIAELALDPPLLDECARHLKLIVYIGGHLPQALGDAVAAKIRLRCQWGASEVGTPQQLISNELGPMDWQYIQFHPASGAEFEEAADGLSELVFNRRPELSQYQALFTVRGQEQLDVYRTRDYFSQHPTVPDAWCWQARADDIVVFLNGEKTNPLPMEQKVVAQNPELSAALVFGSQRFQAGLLIEPVNVDSALTVADRAALIERIWPSVERANRDSPAHARVEKSFILVSQADKPMIRSGKGTVQRSGTLKQYASEIEKAYTDADTLVPDDGCAGPREDFSTLSVAAAVLGSVQSVTDWGSLADDDVFFDKGMDSLQALQLTRALRRRLGRPELSLSMLYANPTISLLAKAISASESVASQDHDVLTSLQSTYTSLIKSIATATRTRPLDVILTGSTGHLGIHILHSILAHPDLGHVFCLNRGLDGGRDVQIERLKAAGLLASDDIDSRVTFLHADLAHPRLGLDNEMYKTLASRTGLIIHNAWPVNFVLQLHSFRPQLAGIVNLCTLAASAVPRPAKIVFVSSVSAVLPSSGNRAPETIVDTPPLSLQGYGRSKFISERLLDTAARDLGIPAIVARVGQVAGAVRQKGLWNTSEWLPSMIGSSLHLGCLPDNLGVMQQVDWIPSDILGDVIVDIAMTADEAPLARGRSGALVVNLRNPTVASWTELVLTAQRAAKEFQCKELEVVPPAVWLERLRESSTELAKDGGMNEIGATITRNPALRLFDFYSNNLWAREVPAGLMEVGLGSQLSPTLASLSAVNGAWMAKWMEEWMEERRGLV